MMHNIEKSGFHKGQYVGYGGGAVWRIIKSNGLWRAIEQGEGAKFKSNFMVCNTLREASERLDKLDAHKKNPLPRARVDRPGYVGKKSQITGRAPSPRLKKRRAKNTEQGYFPNPINDKIALHFDAGHDTNGNPRRVYVVINTSGAVVEAMDEGYIGNSAVKIAYPGISIIGRFEIKPAQYKELLRDYRKKQS